jgi:hypothetical protein
MMPPSPGGQPAAVAQCAAPLALDCIHVLCHPLTRRPGRPESLMAIKSTIYKAALQIADMDRSLYADHMR